MINAQDENLGVVQELMETGAHAILSIQSRNARRAILVPFTEEHVESVDTQAKQVRELAIGLVLMKLRAQSCG